MGGCVGVPTSVCVLSAQNSLYSCSIYFMIAFFFFLTTLDFVNKCFCLLNT